ncbi:hypothetical protein ONZ51_g7662 [Trametes cubensis]|uniref:Uncharacterized protein n=1 Tax=Trametes cubensis TaxID=1111947 RepID=A0AAD7X8Y7_9APHY|nr:hypothetical protein ONZ51_g7662 [Trametes cubensis]
MDKVTHEKGQPESSLAMNWLACDYDVATPVFLVVEPGLNTQSSRWSIAWPVGGPTQDKMSAWCYISAYPDPGLVDLDEPPRYTYTHPMTKTMVLHDGRVRTCQLCTMTFAQRKVIQELAKATHTHSASGNSETNCEEASRSWVTELMHKMAIAGLMPDSALDAVSAAASDAPTSHA